MLAVYAPKVRELETVIGKLKGELRKGGIGAGSLGNFVTDGILTEARLKLGNSVNLAVTNGGGLRADKKSDGANALDLKLLRGVLEKLLAVYKAASA